MAGIQWLMGNLVTSELLTLNMVDTGLEIQHGSRLQEGIEQNLWESSCALTRATRWGRSTSHSCQPPPCTMTSCSNSLFHPLSITTHLIVNSCNYRYSCRSDNLFMFLFRCVFFLVFTFVLCYLGLFLHFFYQLLQNWSCHLGISIHPSTQM